MAESVGLLDVVLDKAWGGGLGCVSFGDEELIDDNEQY